MTIHIDILAQEASRQAAQIGSLAAAANCIAAGSCPADRVARDNIVLNILDVIEELAGQVEVTTEEIEAETAPKPG
ncbi:MAG: hypothetical protein PHQ05_10120 [Sterolibacterium sp.]|nr:hypothetical protein [Sterolibacterium sp.]